MKKIILFLSIIFSVGNAFSSVDPQPQSWLNKPAESIFTNAVIWNNLHDEAAQTSVAINYLQKKLPVCFSNKSSLQKVFYAQSPAGVHITFTQVFSGVPIYGSSVKINLLKNGRVTSVFHKVISTQNWYENYLFTAVKFQLQNIIGDFYMPDIEPVWYVQDINFKNIEAVKVEYANGDGTNHTEAVFDRNYNLLFEIKKARHNKPDTLVKAFVFYPDPLTSAQKAYGPPYVDADDSGLTVLNNERVQKQFHTLFKNDTFYLENKFARLEQISLPKTTVTYSTSPFFNFSRSESGFEDVNVFFHIENYQQRIKFLGFDSLGNYILPVDAHALNGADNSEFNFFEQKLKLLFGTGGIDDAEDADVIIHEYCHFLSYFAAGDNGYGGERLALEEGLADYFACAYSKDISTYNWQKVYSWDGNAPSWSGRSCASGKVYPKDYQGNKWKDGEIWSSALMEIHDNIGRDKTDALMLYVLYQTSKYMTLTQAAKLFLQADTILYGATDIWPIGQAFIRHGLLPDSFFISVPEYKNELQAKINAYYFSSHGLVYIDLDKAENCNISLYDALGRKVFFQPAIYGDKLKIYTPELASGMYILQLQAGDEQKSFKLVKD